jgi:hypothetical protein
MENTAEPETPGVVDLYDRFSDALGRLLNGQDEGNVDIVGNNLAGPNRCNP